MAKGKPGRLAPLLRSIADSRGHKLTVLVFDNANTVDYSESLKLIRKKGWTHYRSPQQLSEDAFSKWVYSHLHAHRALHYIFLPETAQIHEHFFPCALASWEEIPDPKKGALSVVGVRSRPASAPVQTGAELSQRTETLGAFFLTDAAGVEILRGWSPERGLPCKDFNARGLNVYRVQRSLVNTVVRDTLPASDAQPPMLPPSRTGKRVAPDHPSAARSWPLKAPEQPQKSSGKAAFLVATNHRPELLKACLRALSVQFVPEGWDYEILVIGTEGDEGRSMAVRFPRTRYVVAKGETVTTKLNTSLNETDADLLLLADDDDLQPPDRLKAAIEAYDRGAGWSGVGTIIFYDPEKDRAMEWSGKSSLGLVGTSLSFKASILRQTGGWPERKSGKDSPLARRIEQLPGVTYMDLTDKIGRIICLQHSSNIWKRPIIELGGQSSKGKFRIKGMGTAKQAGILHTTRLLSAKPRIYVAITTCERPEDVMLLLQDIKQSLGEFEVRVIVYDDASAADYTLAKTFIRDNGWQFINMKHRHGKHGYIKLMSRVFNDALRAAADYYYFIQDDIRLCSEFFGRTTTLWDDIDDPKKATLFLLKDDSRGATGVAPWTGVKATPAGRVDRTQWVDGNAFMFGPNIRFAMPHGHIPRPPSSWFFNPTHGSGFGRQVSRGLNDKGFNLYQSRQSYVAHVHRSSIMNPLTRAANPLSAISFVDGTENPKTTIKEEDPIIASLASIPGRVNQLQEVVRRLLPQVDRLNVYLNNYGGKPDFLNHPSIVVEMSETCPFGDQGDAGKFYWADDIEGYHIVLDDDVAYPPDLVATLIRWVDQYQRKAVVGCHGVVLTEPFTSYYNNRVVNHFKSEVAHPIPVQCIATNSCCYHTSTIKVSRDDFKHPNMADIWLALLGQHQKVPFVCIPHKAGWLSDLQGYNMGDSIYAHSKRKVASVKNTADIQTQTVKESLPWVIHRAQTGPVKKAAFLVPTTNRPELLRLVLASLKAQRVPDGWACEILVGGNPKDPGKAIALSMGARYVDVMAPYPGAKLNACAAQTDAELYLAADDDDIQSPRRLEATVAACRGGQHWVSCSCVWFHDRESQKTAWWTGPAHLVGTTTAMTAEVFKTVGGWPGVSKGKEDLLAKRMKQKGVSCHDMGDTVGVETVCLQHPTNIWKHPFPEPGASTSRGSFRIRGMSPSDLPDGVVQLLEGVVLPMNLAGIARKGDG